MDNTEKYIQTHKISVKIANFLLIFYIFSSIVLILFYNITDFSIQLTQNFIPYMSIIISNVITAFLCTILIISLILKNRKTKSEIKEILIFFFTFSAFPAYILGFHYFASANSSILVEYNLISPQFLIPGATFFLAFFVSEIFDKGIEIQQNRKKLSIIAFICLIACILNFVYMFFGIGEESIKETAIIINVFYYLIILPLYAYYYMMLMIKSLILIKKLQDDIYRKGIKALALGGFILGFIFIIRIIIFTISPASVLLWDVISGILDYATLLGYILLYIGITLPTRNKEIKVNVERPSKMMKKIIEMQLKKKQKKQKSITASTIIETREEYEKSGKMMQIAKNMTIEKKEINGIPAELISLEQNKSQKIILYLHGGGYLFCSINTHRALASQIVEQTHIPVLIIDYHRAPEYKFPRALEDVVDVYKWLLNSESYAPENIIIGGDSAGGGLAIASLLKLKEMKIQLPKAAFLISPWTDLTFSGDSIKSKQDVDVVLEPESLKMWASNYLGEADPKNPYASPLFGDLSKLPPIFIQVGTSEILFNDSTRLFDRLKEMKNVVEIEIWDQQIHAFPLFGGIKFIGKYLTECKESLEKIHQFIDKRY